MKRAIVFNFIASFTLIASSIAQTSDPVLMRINGKPILKSDFEYIYNKNNSSNSLDKKSLNDYVDLFVNFKLKVEEAKNQGIDTTSSFKSELKGYRNQLIKPYMTDQNVEKALLEEAYNHTKEIVEVSHIALQIKQTDTPSDTLEIWRKIQSIAKRVQTEDFSKVATEASDDQRTKEKGGYIGWVLYPAYYTFETSAYNTPIGGISKPFRTPFGYHIIKVLNKKPNPGQVLAAHIMELTKPNGSNINNEAKVRIDSIYGRIKFGDDFGSLAKKFSQDKNSAINNGELPWFGIGQMIPEFEKVAFSLKTGEISQPFETKYGWHIVKLIDKKELQSFDDLKPELERKMKYDVRSKLPEQTFINNLKSTYQFKLTQSSVDEFTTLLNNKVPSDSVFLQKITTLKKPLFRFADKSYTQANFASYLKENQMTEKSNSGNIINEKLDTYITQELEAYEDSQLEQKNSEIRHLLQEYHDGILLFEISNREVWDKASKDNEGIAKFFKENTTKYKWEKPHFKGFIIMCKNQETFKAAQNFAKKLKTDTLDKFLAKRLNDSIQYVKTEKGIYAQGDSKIVDVNIFKTNDVIEPDKNYPYVFVWGKTLSEPEEYADVKGLVTADYQDYLEKEWIKKLRRKYNVTIDQETLKTIKAN